MHAKQGTEKIKAKEKEIKKAKRWPNLIYKQVGKGEKQIRLQLLFLEVDSKIQKI